MLDSFYSYFIFKPFYKILFFYLKSQTANPLEKYFNWSSRQFDSVPFDMEKVFTVELQENGDALIGWMSNNEFYDVSYPLGIAKKKFIQKYSSTKETEKRILALKSIIESSFKSLSMSNEHMDNNECFGAFKVNPFS